MKRYEQFPHTADIGVRVFGKDLKELFENAAFAMFDTAADLEGLAGNIVQNFELKNQSTEELLVLWLDELLYNFYTKSIIFYKFDVGILNGSYLQGKAFGRPVGANRNRLKMEIKAVTYHNLNIRKTEAGYEVEIIFDV